MLNPKISFGPTGAPLPQPENTGIKELTNPLEPTQSVWNKILESLKESEKPSVDEKNKQPLFVIIRHTKTPDGKLVIEPMNIESGYEIIEGVPTLNLNKLSEADRKRLEKGDEYHLVYGTYEEQNGAITKPFSQLGEISVSELIKELNKF